MNYVEYGMVMISVWLVWLFIVVDMEISMRVLLSNLLLCILIKITQRNTGH